MKIAGVLMKNSDMRDRTKDFALRIVRMFGQLPTATQARFSASKY